jgi:hypothetical protein
VGKALTLPCTDGHGGSASPAANGSGARHDTAPAAVDASGPATKQLSRPRQIRRRAKEESYVSAVTLGMMMMIGVAIRPSGHGFLALDSLCIGHEAVPVV